MSDWITQWASNNKGNQAVAGAANDLFYNAASAYLQTRSDVNYATQMMPKALEYQRGSQLIATQADLSRMAAEGAIARDLTAQQGQISTGITKLQTDALKYGADRDVDSTRLQTDAQRYGYDQQLAGTRLQTGAQRYGYDQQLAGTRYSADRQLDATRLQTGAERYGYDQQLAGTRLQTGAQRYGYDQQLAGTRYSADRQLDATRLQTGAERYGYDQQLAGTRYSADRQVDATRLQTDAQRYGYDRDLEGRIYVSDNELTGVREGYQSEERQIGLRGSEDRKTLTQGTDETLRLRSDARGAIASTGKRFFG